MLLGKKSPTKVRIGAGKPSEGKKVFTYLKKTMDVVIKQMKNFFLHLFFLVPIPFRSNMLHTSPVFGRSLQGSIAWRHTCRRITLFLNA